MATLLLVRADKKSRGQDLRRTLLHLLHGFHAIENALTSFVIPFGSHESILSIEGHPDILADFDAHVGDTACHMRAQMIWEVYEYYKVPERRVWINDALIALAQVKMRTISVLVALHKRNGYMRALGFGSIVTYGQIFDRIGWSEFLQILNRKSCIPMFGSSAFMSRAESFHSTANSTSALPTPADLDPVKTVHKSEYINILHIDATPSMRYNTPNESTGASRSVSIARSLSTPPLVSSRLSSSPPSSTSDSPSEAAVSTSAPSGSHNYRAITTDCTWDVTNPLTIVRFLTLCRLLSVGKKAKVQAGFPNAAIRARTDPEYIYDQTQKQIEAFYNSADQEIEWTKLISDNDWAKKTFLVKEEETVQVWLSNLTADWSISLAKDVGLSESMQRVLKNSIMISPRQIACVASHPSIVPIRAEWLLRGTPILMLIRRFCSQGYHSTFYRVIPNKSAWSFLPPVKNVRAVELGRQSWFSIQPVTDEEVRTAPWSTTPHFVLISNSIDGTNGEFYDRIAEEGYGDAGAPWPHDCADCEEHNAYLPKVLESNFAGIVMSFFGQHDQYPFDFVSPSNGEDEVDGHEHVADNMKDEGFGCKALAHYWRSIQEVEESGTGERPWMYTLEHAYTELPFVVGRHVKDIIEKKIQPVPIGYRWW